MTAAAAIAMQLAQVTHSLKMTDGNVVYHTTMNAMSVAILEYQQRMGTSRNMRV